MIEPVDLPTAAGQDYGSGDVRHFAQGDAVDVPGMSNPTRQLAQRDNILAEKVNEVVETVNNHEQFVPLPVMRTIVAPGDQTLASNYRIPLGFEARVLNATVGASPASTDAQLDIYYNTTFGNSTGTDIVTTTSGAEFTGETSFHPSGEFIISLKNRGALTLEISASVLLTMRPVGSTGSLLVGNTAVVGPSGPPGPTGPPGPPGPAGNASSGSAGMTWRGVWSSTTAYVANDVVQFTRTYGALTGAVSSFICIQSNTGQSPDDTISGPSAYWSVVAEGGLPGAQGSQGVPGIGTQPYIGQQTVNGTLITLSSFVGYRNTLPVVGDHFSAYDIDQGGLYVANGTYLFTCNESLVLDVAAQSGPAGPAWYKGMAILNSKFGLTFQGACLVKLPSIVDGAFANYTFYNAGVSVVPQGTFYDWGTLSGTSVFACPLTINTLMAGPNQSVTNEFYVINENQGPIVAEFVVAGVAMIS